MRYLGFIVFLVCTSPAIAGPAYVLSEAEPGTRLTVVQKPLSKQEAFIGFMVPKIKRANAMIRKRREHLLGLYADWRREKLSAVGSVSWLKSLARKYGFKRFDPEKDAAWQALIKRVDTLPVSMVLAQAINESAWGQSYFAREGKNYFGQHCQVAGCGIVPRRRAAGSTMEVKVFESAALSVMSYMRNLNTNSAYQRVRSIRYQLRAENKPLAGLELIKGLSTYSSRGEAYVNSLSSLIKNYKLSRYNS